MRNIKINEAETIFEPFWDSGESYPDHHKYTCLSQYRIATGNQGEVSPQWNAVQIEILPGRTDGYPIVMERDCALDIAGYDRFRLYARIPERIEFIVTCVIDGQERDVLHRTGYGSDGEYTGEISGKLITSIRLSFRNLTNVKSSAELTWMGLSNHEKELAMLSEKNPYTPDWEGCFRDDEIDFTPQLGVFFDAEGLEALREKVKSEPFARIMDNLRAQAEENLAIEPEQYVGDYVNNRDRRWVRDRDVDKPDLRESMKILAFVGLMDKNREMLRMACRMALTLAHCRYFCESIMGVFPGATWHHRSFLEGDTCVALSCVLDWAGGLLTWHGSNIIFDAMIIKGLPRMDADIKTMDYIWEMNQGSVFSSRLVITLIALAKRYGRYAVRVEEAERDMLAMWENYMQPDGGDAEGPAYWDFTLQSMSVALRLLAAWHGKSLAEYLPNSIKRSADFGEAVLTGDGFCYQPLNDTHPGNHFSAKTVALLAEAGAGKVWQEMNNHILMKGEDLSIDDVIFGRYYENVGFGETKRVFLSLPDTGITTLRRSTVDLGMVSFTAVSGVSTFGHDHADKGSFLLEAEGQPLLIDPGVVNYSDADVGMICLSERHNMITAVSDGHHLSQGREDLAFSAKVLEARYANGVFSYATDVTSSWGGVFGKNVRTVTSRDPHSYIVEDDLAIDPALQVCFILNTYGDIHLSEGDISITYAGVRARILPRGWKPDKAEAHPYGTDGEKKPVNRLCLYRSGCETYRLTTEILLSRA